MKSAVLRGAWLSVEEGAVGYFTRWMQYLYNYCSTDPLAERLGELPLELAELVRLAWQGDGVLRPYSAAWVETPRVSEGSVQCNNDSNIVLGFTGGKDGVACALRAAAGGLDPILVNMRGLNHDYPREAGSSERLAGLLGMRYVPVKCRITGRSAWSDNHVKNQVVLAVLIDWGLRNGVRWVSIGDQSEITDMKDSSYGYDWSDCKEMIIAFNEWVTAKWPSYRWRYLLRNYTDAFKVIYEQNPDLLWLVRSCISPTRFQDFWREGNLKKFGVRLLPGRCGSCYKCCMEWLNWVALGGFEMNEGFCRHCITILRKQWGRMYSGKVPRTDSVILERHVDPTLANAVRLGWRRCDSEKYGSAEVVGGQ